MNKPDISVVIPVHNEEANLGKLYNRLIPVMDSLQKCYEVIFTNDGSQDKSAKILNELHERHPDAIRIIHFNSKYGQHSAIMAGLEKAQGEIVITMDANLQTLPEDIPKLIEKIEAGHDVVGGCRENRKDKLWRTAASKLHHLICAKMMPKIIMKDQGCMLRAYQEHIVDLMIMSKESNTFTPALALNYAHNPTEIPVSHDPLIQGQSKYNFYKLIRYNFDLITNFSLTPLHLFTLLGIFVSCLSGFLVVYMLIRRLFDGPEVQGVFTLFTIAFFFIGLCLLGLGILGEYIGRIYQEVRERPRFIIRNIQEKPNEP